MLKQAELLFARIKEEGIYDFSYLDEIMALWGPRGYRFSLRVCSYEGDPNLSYATPAYVYKKGARGYRLPSGALQPDYGDPIFLCLRCKSSSN